MLIYTEKTIAAVDSPNNFHKGESPIDPKVHFTNTGGTNTLSNVPFARGLTSIYMTNAKPETNAIRRAINSINCERLRLLYTRVRKPIIDTIKRMDITSTVTLLVIQ